MRHLFAWACVVLTVWAVFKCSEARADEWRTSDTVREGIGLSLLAVDWGQTRTIARNPQLYYEQNRFLGDHPSVAAVDKYFIGMMVLHPIVSVLLPTDAHIGSMHFDPRAAWQYVTIGIEAGAVANNYSIGIRATW